MGKLFGTDGIRGVANTYPMTADMALKIGKATAHLFKREGHTPRIIIGKDTRISGYMLENALISGICSMGVNAILVGPIPTPDLILSKDLDALNSSSHTLGKSYRMEDARGRYTVFLKHSFPKKYTLEGTKVVLDCANGATYKVAAETFFELGAEVTTLFNEPNGMNINLNCGSQHPEVLAQEVVKRKADVGFAFDGDGENGTVITGDQIMALCAKVMKKEGELTNNLVVATVMSNIGLGLALKDLGIELLATKVGDRYVLEKMQETGASIGGEESGHLIFLQHHTTGDGILSALQILAAMKSEQKPLSELARIMKVFPQKLINLTVKNKPDISTVPDIVKVITEVEEQLGDQGRVLVRYSGTQPMCRVMVEGPTQEDTDKFCQKIAEVVQEKLN